jgi:VWFA-related protein
MQREDRAYATDIGAMDAIASATGGHVISTTNDLAGALQRAVVDGAHYYTLAYTPSNKTIDGRFRSIRVTIRRGAYQLTYRRGYYASDALLGTARSPPNAPADPLTPVMGHGRAPATQLL